MGQMAQRMTHLSRSPSPQLPGESSPVRWIIAGLSLFVVVAVVTVMMTPPAPSALDSASLAESDTLTLLQTATNSAEPGVRSKNMPTLLARINVSLNAAAGTFLLLGYAFIRRRRTVAHRRSMLAAFGMSTIFLVTYLLHHAQVGSVPFRGHGLIRGLYFGLLVPHIVLAAAIVPLALLTLYRGWTGRLPQHRKIAQYTLPLWLYVSLSGVAVYFLLYGVAGPLPHRPAP